MVACKDIIKEMEHRKRLSESIKKTFETNNTLNKMSQILKQRWSNPEYREKKINSMTGLKRTEASRKKMSDAAKGKPKLLSEEQRKRRSELSKGRKHSKESIKKIRESKLGKHPSEETRKKLITSHIGQKAWNKDKECPQWSGEKSPVWKGGVSFEPYCEKFNRNFKKRTRAFWNHTCFLCGGLENGRSHTVHHIHYDKKMCCNGSPQDVIILCASCHAKTNHNRDYWESHLTNLLYAYCPSGKCFFTKDEMRSYQLS